MPTIAVFFGVIIRMYWRDHAPPHVHAYYQGHRALIEIETGEVIGGHLPLRAESLVREWVLSQREALMANWERGRRLMPFEKVPGADQE
jgi:Domain of unknown function (DUF4160)